jgi:hypothetical protein
MSELLTLVLEAAGLLAAGITLFSLVGTVRNEFAHPAHPDFFLTKPVAPGAVRSGDLDR